MSQADQRNVARTAPAKRPLTSFFESSTPAYLVGASVGIFLGAVLILGLTLALR
jgi:hypothetical protein